MLLQNLFRLDKQKLNILTKHFDYFEWSSRHEFWLSDCYNAPHPDIKIIQEKEQLELKIERNGCKFDFLLYGVSANSGQVKVKEGITTFLVSTSAKCDRELSQPKHTAVISIKIKFMKKEEAAIEFLLLL